MNVSKLGLKKKLLVAAMAMAVSGGASALDLPSTTGGSELIFNIWDPTVGQEASYTLGLDVQISALSTAPGATLNLASGIFSDADFVNFLGGHNTSALRWNVAAGSNEFGDAEWGAFTHAPVGGALSILNAQAQNVAGTVANFGGQFGSANEGGFAGVGPKYAGGTGWNGTLAGSIFQGTDGKIGDSLGFYLFTNNMAPNYETFPDDPATGGAFQNQYGFSSITLDANGNLNFASASAPTPAVPVPAAVWLLGSAMVGLVGVARRRNSEKA